MHHYRLITAAVVALALSTAANAQTWTGGGADGNWSTAANWTASPTNGSTVTFSNSASITNLATNNDLVTSLAGIAVNATAGAGPITIGGTAFSLGAGGINMTGATQNLAVNTDVSLSGGQTWTVNAGRTLTIGASSSNTLNLSTGTGNTLTLTGVQTSSAGATMIFNSVIADGAASSGLSFTSSGAFNTGATIQMLAANTYTGGTTLNARAAAFQVGSDQPFGATNGTTTGTITLVANNTSPNFQSINGSHTIPNPIDFTQGGFNTGGSNSLTFSGNLNVAVTRTISVSTTAGNTVTFSGTVTIASGQTFSAGEGGAPSAPDATVVYSGLVTGPGTLASNGNGNQTGGNNVDQIQVTNQNTYSGGTSMLGAGATWTIGSSSDGTAASFTKGPFGTGAVTVNNATKAPILQAINGTQTVNNAFTLTSSLQVQGSTDITLNGVIGSTGGIIKQGTNTLTLTNTNTYAGTTTVTGGTLRVNGTNSGAGAVNATGTGTVGSGGTIGGSGSVAGLVTISPSTVGVTSGGIVYPGPGGSTPGTLNVGSMTWNPLGQYVFTYDANNQSTSANGFINGSANLNLNLGGGQFDINLKPLSFFPGTPSPQTYTIATFATGTGLGAGDVTSMFSFSNAAQATFAGSAAPTAAIVGASPSGLQSIQITFTPVPEPTSVLTACGIAGGLGWWRVRRRTTAKASV
jgi:autotransporter-associated beta strand protein